MRRLYLEYTDAEGRIVLQEMIEFERADEHAMAHVIATFIQTLRDARRDAP